MPEQIDILSAPYQYGAMFTVNVAVNSVSLVPVVPGTPMTLTAGGGTIGGGGFEFQEGDNFEILSAGFHIPESFTLAQYSVAAGGEFMLPIMYLRGQVIGGAAPWAPINQFGNNGTLRIPFSDYEMSVGSFVDVIDTGLVSGLASPFGTFVLQTIFPYTVGLDYPQISMINAPAALDGVDIYVTPFIKVRHSFTLS